ncbi:bifunctional folylpolyglutamate synthase/dihydrofolate synthase [Candidatus Peregrinibacteria bacterium]|nr:bifunctional folylpolyglutamate synthase/dihydrofolate synthase [Candidatus Peregrinibacteria bacterium]
MNYPEFTTWLEGLDKFPEEARFERMETMLRVLGNPEKKMKFVHVTGTNGKGSTCAMIESILRSSGQITGLFTSPHLLKYNERIRVGGEDISDDEFLRVGVEVKGIVEGIISENSKMAPSLFEVLFVMTLKYFAEKNVEFGVIEVGLGGRRDPTNVIQSEVSIITNIDLDHTHILGKTREEIALDKAGIIKENGTCITTEKDEKLIEIFSEEAKKKNAKLIVLETEDCDLINQSLKGQVFNFINYQALELPLLGAHQLSNASCAIMCAEVLRNKGLNLTEQDIRQGLKKVKWPLRLEIVRQNPTVIIDGGHTEVAMEFTCETIENLFSGKKKIGIIGFSERKNHKAMLDILIYTVDIFVITEQGYQGMSPEKIVEYLKEKGQTDILLTQNVAEAVKNALFIAKNEDLIMILGGLYLGANAKMCL